jgi:hypothetical protein
MLPVVPPDRIRFADIGDGFWCGTILSQVYMAVKSLADVTPPRHLARRPMDRLAPQVPISDLQLPSLHALSLHQPRQHVKVVSTIRSRTADMSDSADRD